MITDIAKVGEEQKESETVNCHFQPNLNVVKTLVHHLECLTTTSDNGETMSININRLNFHFQPNINVDVFAREEKPN